MISTLLALKWERKNLINSLLAFPFTGGFFSQTLMQSSAMTSRRVSRAFGMMRTSRRMIKTSHDFYPDFKYLNEWEIVKNFIQSKIYD